MTKKQMVEYIGFTGMVINFDFNYLMRRDKDYITSLYNKAKEYEARKGIGK